MTRYVLNMQSPDGGRALEMATAMIAATLEEGEAFQLLGSYELTETMKAGPEMLAMTFFALSQLATVIALTAAQVTGIEPKELLARVARTVHQTMIEGVPPAPPTS